MQGQGDNSWLKSVLIDLQPISCSMRLARSLDPDLETPDSLSIIVRLPLREDVRTPQERSLRAAEWTITLYDGGKGSEFSRENNAVGQLDYLAPMEPGSDDDGFPESCAAWASIDSKTFALLRDMATSGRLPTRICLRVKGLAYGWEPDGSGKVWDIDAMAHVPVSEVRITSDLVSPPERGATAIDGEDFWAQPKPESPELIAARTNIKLVEGLHAQLRWVVFLLAVIAVTLVLR